MSLARRHGGEESRITGGVGGTHNTVAPPMDR